MEGAVVKLASMCTMCTFHETNPMLAAMLDETLTIWYARAWVGAPVARWYVAPS